MPLAKPQAPPPKVEHLNQTELAARWRISARTLERWRWLGQGPRYLKIGGRVIYRLSEVEAYEAGQIRRSTAGADLAMESGR